MQSCYAPLNVVLYEFRSSAEAQNLVVEHAHYKRLSLLDELYCSRFPTISMFSKVTLLLIKLKRKCRKSERKTPVLLPLQNASVQLITTDINTWSLRQFCLAYHSML
jgi:hypothetical protein